MSCVKVLCNTILVRISRQDWTGNNNRPKKSHKARTFRYLCTVQCNIVLKYTYTCIPRCRHYPIIRIMLRNIIQSSTCTLPYGVRHCFKILFSRLPRRLGDLEQTGAYMYLYYSKSYMFTNRTTVLWQFVR